MKNYHLVILWWFCLVFNAVGENADYNRYNYVEEIGNPDDDRIERPCPTYDLNCIRVFFQKHGRCKKTFGPVPDPISRPESNLHISRDNLSISIVDQRVGGLNGRVEEFFINRKTDRLVIAVEFAKLTQSSDKLFFRTFRPAREPVVTRTAYAVEFDPIIITAVIPKLDDLQLNDAECTTYATGGFPRFVVEPSIVTSTDPQPTRGLVTALTDVPEGVQELFLTDTAYLIATYIQYNICDFGLFLT